MPARISFESDSETFVATVALEESSRTDDDNNDEDFFIGEDEEGSCSDMDDAASNTSLRRMRARTTMQRPHMQQPHVPQHHQHQHAEEFIITKEEVIARMERLLQELLTDMDEGILPVLRRVNPNGNEATVGKENVFPEHDENLLPSMNAATAMRRFTLHTCRSYTGMLLVISFCHELLCSGRTTTLREVYYTFVTHFRSQVECNRVIQQVADLLMVPRHALGLKASPRGWFAGDVQLVRRRSSQSDNHTDNVNHSHNRHWHSHCNSYSDNTNDEKTTTLDHHHDVLLDGRVSSAPGHAITSDWLNHRHQRPYALQTVAASCILVIEKEGIYQRLLEDRFCERHHACILVTSRGFPDLATRAFVYALHTELNLPVYGLSDCNPFGFAVLHTFCNHHTKSSLSSSSRRGEHSMIRNDVYDDDDSNKNNNDNNPNSLSSPSSWVLPHMHWMGLRPSQVEALRHCLPDSVLQGLTPRDLKQLDTLLTSSFVVNTTPPNNIVTACSVDPHENWGQRRREELERMRELGYKVELEALHWMGMETMCEFVAKLLDHSLLLHQGNHDRTITTLRGENENDHDSSNMEDSLHAPWLDSI